MRGAGGWGGDRGPRADVNVAARSRARQGRRGEDQREPGAALSPLRRLEPAARGSRLREGVRLREADPPRPVLVRLRDARTSSKAFAPDGDPRFFKSIKVALRVDACSPARRSSPRCGRRATRSSSARKVKERGKVVHLERGRRAVDGAAEAEGRRRRRRRRRGGGAPVPTSARHLPRDRRRSSRGNPATAEKVKTTFLFKLSAPERAVDDRSVDAAGRGARGRGRQGRRARSRSATPTSWRWRPARPTR